VSIRFSLVRLPSIEGIPASARTPRARRPCPGRRLLSTSCPLWRRRRSAGSLPCGLRRLHRAQPIGTHTILGVDECACSEQYTRMRGRSARAASAPERRRPTFQCVRPGTSAVEVRHDGVERLALFRRTGRQRGHDLAGFHPRQDGIFSECSRYSAIQSTRSWPWTPEAGRIHLASRREALSIAGEPGRNSARTSSPPRSSSRGPRLPSWRDRYPTCPAAPA
jgi:hypothetical protein